VGQKTNPKGFRLITTQKHLSNWYTNKFNYLDQIKEDYLIRLKIENLFNKYLTISNIYINKIIQPNNKEEYITISINCLYPRTKELLIILSKLYPKLLITNLNLKNYLIIILKQLIKKIIRSFKIKTNKNYIIKFDFIKNPFTDAILIAKYITSQLEKRVLYKRAIKETIKKIQLTGIKGIKIELSGRLNGIDIARSEWKREGKIPLHTLKAKIDYTCQTAKTIYGIIGIKIWLFLDI
jgi:small subunit ribosomal protein S3